MTDMTVTFIINQLICDYAFILDQDGKCFITPNISILETYKTQTSSLKMKDHF